MTEKDAARLINNPLCQFTKISLYALPIRVKILNNNETALIKKLPIMLKKIQETASYLKKI